MIGKTKQKYFTMLSAKILKGALTLILAFCVYVPRGEGCEWGWQTVVGRGGEGGSMSLLTLFVTLVMQNKLRYHTHFEFSANQTT